MSWESDPLFQPLEGNADSRRFPPIPHMIPADSRQLSSPIPVPPPIGGNRETGRSKPTQQFAANTCPKCGAITITGTTYGLVLHLEPRTLNDHTEYAALTDNVRTYNLHPDRTASRRNLEEIRRPTRVPRHAEHTCGHNYGTDPRPQPATPPRPDPNGPPPF